MSGVATRASFLKGAGQTLLYFRQVIRERARRPLGHTPAGAAMLVTLSGTAFAGWLMEHEACLAVPVFMPAIVAPAGANDVGNGDEREYGARGKVEGPLKKVHETLANLILPLAATQMHDLVLQAFRLNENLARAMLRGAKYGPEPGEPLSKADRRCGSAGPHPRQRGPFRPSLLFS